MVEENREDHRKDNGFGCRGDSLLTETGLPNFQKGEGQ